MAFCLYAHASCCFAAWIRGCRPEGSSLHLKKWSCSLSWALLQPDALRSFVSKVTGRNTWKISRRTNILLFRRTLDHDLKRCALFSSFGKQEAFFKKLQHLLNHRARVSSSRTDLAVFRALLISFVFSFNCLSHCTQCLDFILCFSQCCVCILKMRKRRCGSRACPKAV